MAAEGPLSPTPGGGRGSSAFLDRLPSTPPAITRRAGRQQVLGYGSPPVSPSPREQVSQGMQRTASAPPPSPLAGPPAPPATPSRSTSVPDGTPTNRSTRQSRSTSGLTPSKRKGCNDALRPLLDNLPHGPSGQDDVNRGLCTLGFPADGDESSVSRYGPDFACYPHQATGADWIIGQENDPDRLGGALFDDGGMGRFTTMLMAFVQQGFAQILPDRTKMRTVLVVHSGSTEARRKEITDRVGRDVDVIIFSSTLKVERLERSDIVIVSAETLSRDLKDDPETSLSDAMSRLGIGSSPSRARSAKAWLMATAHHRLWVHDAHVMQTPESKTTQAIFALRATHRWLSTPSIINNQPFSFLSWLRFLKGSSFQSQFTSLRAEPDASYAASVINEMKHWAIRRTHDTLARYPALALSKPGVNTRIVFVEPTRDEEACMSYLIHRDGDQPVNSHWTEGVVIKPTNHRWQRQMQCRLASIHPVLNIQANTGTPYADERRRAVRTLGVRRVNIVSQRINNRANISCVVCNISLDDDGIISAPAVRAIADTPLSIPIRAFCSTCFQIATAAVDNSDGSSSSSGSSADPQLDDAAYPLGAFSVESAMQAIASASSSVLQSLGSSASSLSQVSISSKLRETKTVINARLRRGPQDKVLVLSFSRGALSLLEQQLEGRSFMSMIGSLESDERRRICNAFCNDRDARILLANTLSADMANYDGFECISCIISIDVLPDGGVALRRLVGDVRQLGQHRPIDLIILACRGSIEEEYLRNSGVNIPE